MVAQDPTGTGSATWDAGIAGSPPEADGMASDSSPIRYRHTPRPYDADGVRRAVRDLLAAVGEDPDREGLLGTPDRLARSFAEIFAGLAEDPADHLDAVFDIGHEEMVLVRDIPLYSMCEHHLLPFHGVAHVGYIPAENGRVTGLSKLARLVEGYARRPQVQERLTSQVADALVDRLEPRGVIVVVEAEHLCMSMRGVRKPGSRTITSAVRGQMRRAATRAEAMSLLVNRA
ncbi:GTP cyclohydrolase I [Georgenia soli]|uniref:GTP cyclohydrolase 1 n=2 Tax=Georgenia soli TaxID=638953 RepID=A0A2A9ENY2_9MICO|nr:GTP cyclohydrolase I [Georgenia soli]